MRRLTILASACLIAALLPLLHLSIIAVEAQSTPPISANIRETCFSPGGDCASRIVYWINRANSSIHIMIYEFTLDNIGDALVHAKQTNPNLDIKIIWDSNGISQTNSQYQKLAHANIDITIDTRPGLMHDKVAIIDGHIVITGSFNWTSNANNVNRENLIIIDSQPLASMYEQNFQQNYNDLSQ